MSFRKIYSQIGLFAGPAPSSGYHFVDFSGNATNSIYAFSGSTLGYSYNAIKPFNRIIDAGYGFAESRIDVKQLGDYGTVSRPTIANTPVSLQFSYYSMGLYNEALMGFNISSGRNITPISGFIDRTLITGIYNDIRNIFIATNDYDDELKTAPFITQTLNGTKSTVIKNNINVFAFGDCFIDSYKYSASVGSIPQVSVAYICNNVMYHYGGSGNIIPSVNTKTFSLNTGVSYILPSLYTGTQASVILPGDITLSISPSQSSSSFQNSFFDFSDIKIQNFQIDISLNREPIINLGYRLPMDRIVNFPTYANLSFSAIAGDSYTGSFINFINTDTEYDISINLKYSKAQPFTGTAIMFSFLGCKFNSIKGTDSLSNDRLTELSFTSELNPNYNNKGFFISGQLGQ